MTTVRSNSSHGERQESCQRALAIPLVEATSNLRHLPVEADLGHFLDARSSMTSFCWATDCCVAPGQEFKDRLRFMP